MHGPRLILLVLVGAVILATAAAVYVVGQDHPLNRPCPMGSRTISPSQTHFAPGILQHQSWVGIPPSEVTDGEVIVVCTDGEAIGRAIMDPIDLASETVELEIPTRWVDWTWATGKLDAYRDQTRWTIVFPPSSSTE